jgi:hypothetical protein
MGEQTRRLGSGRSQSQVQSDSEVVVSQLRLSISAPWAVPTVQVGLAGSSLRPK